MHFKGPIWEYDQKFESFFKTNTTGLYCQYFFDSFSEKIFLDRLKRIFSKKVKLFLGNELTADTLKSEVDSNDLFKEPKVIFIFLAEQLSPKKFLTTLEQIDFGDDLCILSFGSKNSLYTSIQKQKLGFCHSIEEPKFWESEKLLTYLSRCMRVNIGPALRSYILDFIPCSCDDYVRSLNIIRHNELEKADLETIKELFGQSKFDKFLLAEQFSSKSFYEFFNNILSIDSESKEYISFFSFMQNHLIKLADPTLISKKSTLTKYDRAIISQSSKWGPSQIKWGLKLFREFELISKKNNQAMLKEVMRLNYLRVQSSKFI